MDIDTLAGMMAEGFASIEKSFGQFQEYIEDRFNALEDHMNERFGVLENRMETLEKEVRLTNQHIDRIVTPLLDSHTTRIKNLELKLT